MKTRLASSGRDATGKKPTGWCWGLVPGVAANGPRVPRLRASCVQLLTVASSPRHGRGRPPDKVDLAGETDGSPGLAQRRRHDAPRDKVSDLPESSAQQGGVGPKLVAGAARTRPAPTAGASTSPTSKPARTRVSRTKSRGPPAACTAPERSPLSSTAQANQRRDFSQSVRTRPRSTSHSSAVDAPRLASSRRTGAR